MRYPVVMALAWADHSLLERMVSAVERVRDRLSRATTALESAGVPYAVVGGNAVAAWVATIDTGAVRNTQDVDILLRRGDLAAAEAAMTVAGFIRHKTSETLVFLDSQGLGPRDVVNLYLASEKVRANDLTPAPDLGNSIKQNAMRIIPLASLVCMQLTSNRTANKMYMRDMLDVGLIDSTWPARLPTELGSRLQVLIDTPES